MAEASAAAEVAAPGRASGPTSTPIASASTGSTLAQANSGPLSSGKLSSGRTFTAADASSDVALVDSNYAAQNKLTTGSTIAIGNSSGTATNFKVIGIVGESAGDNPSDVYIPLAVAQTLANMRGDVNTIYVAASSSSNIPAVQSEIQKALPSYTVTTSADLANEVTGSLSSASSLANNLGKWLAIAVLIAAFLLASLLTLSAVSRRVREFGTLKAIGWRSRRIVGQVMGESVTLGLIGGVIGVGLGFAGAELVTKLSKPLSATPGQTTGSATPGGARQFGFGRRGGRRLRRRWRRWRQLRRVARCHQRGQPHRDRSPPRFGHRGNHRARGGARRGGRHHRRDVRRMAGGPAAPGGRAVQGRLTVAREVHVNGSKSRCTSSPELPRTTR